MPPKRKIQEKVANPLIPPFIDLDHIPSRDRDYRLNETHCDYDFLESYCWLEDRNVDKSDEVRLWESKPVMSLPKELSWPPLVTFPLPLLPSP